MSVIDIVQRKGMDISEYDRGGQIKVMTDQQLANGVRWEDVEPVWTSHDDISFKYVKAVVAGFLAANAAVVRYQAGAYGMGNGEYFWRDR